MHGDQKQWYLLRTLPEALATAQNLQDEPRTSPKLLHTSHRAPLVAETIQDLDDIPSLNIPPSPAVTAAICQMVEDPYFDTPMSSPPSEESPMDSSEDAKQWTDSSIFCTPSLFLNDQTLELNSPASGTEVHMDEEVPPPLPQRTPESFIMAVDAEHSAPYEGLLVIIPPNAAAEAVLELGVPESHPDFASCTTPNLHPYCPPLDPLTPPLLPQTEEILSPALPDRTPESFILITDEQKPLTAVRQLAPLPVVVAGGGSEQVGQHAANHRLSSNTNTETPAVKSDKGNEKGVLRTKSLKFFRHKQKLLATPPWVLSPCGRAQGVTVGSGLAGEEKENGPEVGLRSLGRCSSSLSFPSGWYCWRRMCQARLQTADTVLNWWMTFRGMK
ncbi:hypothetical protein FQN60_002245 [Etheostoma spectabile]|uniref:Uncharacterized protein n=1 Tax=Etheostoma spectabile TaxID=54343 RepID=A0A5J5D9F3_9PERO|nr:hypothetical protein FQN60_002245 [Etheostoma spectabile]